MKVGTRHAAAMLLCLQALPLGAQPSPGPAPELGRLFFAPTERADIERDRGKPSREPAAVEGPESVTVNGVITRRGAPAVPLINGRALARGESLSGLTITGLADGRVRVTRNADGKSGLARPGQTVDLATGEVREPFDVADNRKRDALPPQSLPYTSGVPAPVAEKATAGKPVKTRRPRRAKRSSGKTPAAPPAPPARAEAPAAPVPPMSAPAPGIPAAPR